jgi:hypothetical protein
MRDKKRKERAMLEEAYGKVNENLGPAALTASVPGVSQVPLVVGENPVEDESCLEYDQSEIDMAGRELLKAQEYATKLSEIVPTLPGLDGWVASKITKAADYLSSVFHYLDYEINETEDVVIDVQEIEIPVDQFNIGHEDAGST